MFRFSFYIVRIVLQRREWARPFRVFVFASPGAKGRRIATPVFALVRNDTGFFTQQCHLYIVRFPTLRNGRARSLQTFHFYMMRIRVPRGRGLPHQCAHWFAMTHLFTLPCHLFIPRSFLHLLFHYSLLLVTLRQPGRAQGTSPMRPANSSLLIPNSKLHSPLSKLHSQHGRARSLRCELNVCRTLRRSASRAW